MWRFTRFLFRNIEPTNDQLEFPRFSICLDPPMSASRLAELGISQRAWDLQNDGNVEWPITSKNQSSLFDRCTYSFKEVFRNVHIGHPIGKSEHFSSAKLLWKVSTCLGHQPLYIKTIDQNNFQIYTVGQTKAL